MSKLDEKIARIKTEHVGVTGVSVLVVEGRDDVDALRIFLDRKFPGWERSWHIEDAGNKLQVLGMLQKESTWLGMVDRDDWTPAESVRYTQTQTNLVVLPRFCLESYLINPDELWQAFPDKQRRKIVGGLSQLRSEIFQGKADWRRHAALWHVIQPLWRTLRELGFPNHVLASPPVPDDVALGVKLREWHAALDATVILAEVQALETRLTTESDAIVCAQWLYAKSFYPEVVHRVLDGLLGQKSAKERRLSILRSLPIPSDLDALWQRMDLI